MKVECSEEYYRNTMMLLNAYDLKTVLIETGAVLQYLSLKNLGMDNFKILIEKRLKKIWAIGSGATGQKGI